MCQILPYISLWYLQYSMFYLLSLLTKTTGGHQTPTVLIINHIFCCYRYVTTETSWCKDIITYSREIRKKIGEGNSTPLQYSCLENPMDGRAWWAAVHGVTKSQTWLSDLTFTFHFHALEKAMATHSSVLAWRIPGTGEPGELLPMGSHRVGHNWSDLAAASKKIVFGQN